VEVIILSLNIYVLEEISCFTGFYIPSDSGEKVAMGITTLLSMTVFLMLVTEAMPPTADSLPLIGNELYTLQ